MVGLSIGDEVFDERTLFQFEVIDQGHMGRGVRYVGRYVSESSNVLDETYVIPSGKKLCYFIGDIYMDKNEITSDSDTETDERINIIKNRQRYQDVLHSWKKNYVIEINRGIMVVPKANRAQDIDNIAFLVNTDKPSKCNCVIGTSTTSYSCWWKSLKKIRPGDILFGLYGEVSKKYGSYKKSPQKIEPEMKRRAPDKDEEKVISSSSSSDLPLDSVYQRKKKRRLLVNSDSEDEAIFQLPPKSSVPQKESFHEQKSLLITQVHPHADQRYQRMLQMPWNQYAKHLQTHGYVVIPVLDAQECREFHQAFYHDMKTYPEYLHPEHKDTVFMKSGFGAFGNPASFHSPAVRSLRLRMMHPAIHLFRELNRLENRQRSVEQLPDRVSLRRQGTSATAESWHRDQGAIPFDTDDIMGGWINLDLKENQYFSGVPGTHRDAKGPSGFQVLTKEEKVAASERKQRIEIPPGHWFCFYQHMIHEVVSKKMKYDSLRLYTGFRLTESEVHLFSSANKVLRKSKDFKTFPSNYTTENMLAMQGVPPLPSGQYPPMYARNNLIYPKQRAATVEWSVATFKPRCVHPVMVVGEANLVVDRFMKSLAEYDLPLYEPYATFEKDILYPKKVWVLPFYGMMKRVNIS